MMTHKIRRRIRGWLGREADHQVDILRIEFRLLYKEVPIGVLSFENAVWEWKYSPEFRAQNELVPLIEFPDVSAVYRTGELWPFFATRAPSLKRPDILQIIEREQLERDEVSLLKRFGQRTIANPFELIAA